MHNSLHILPGQKFNRLTIVREENNVSPDGKFLRRRFLCRCDCGKEKTVYLLYLTTGDTKSCGCLDREKKGERLRTHGLSKTRAYAAWLAAVQRCVNPENPRYKDYGGRGIKVCERWANSIEAFIEDMGEPPPGWTIERVDVDRGYEPGNCVWATADHQARNTTRNVMLTIDGKTKCLAEWCREYNINYVTVSYRMRKNGWSPLEALTAPNRRQRKTALSGGQ